MSNDTRVSSGISESCHRTQAIAHDALRALINLTDSPLWVAALSESSFLSYLVSYIVHPPSVLADLAAMLLSNLSAQPSVCTQLLSLKIPVVLDSSLEYRYYPPQSRSGTSPTPQLKAPGEPIELPALPLLVDAFAFSAKAVNNTKGSIRKGELHFLSSVFANLSVTAAGRLFFVTPSSADALSTSNLEYPISKLTAFTEHADTIRRGGVASVIKNCSFHAPAHRSLLAPEDERVTVPPSDIAAPGVNILPAILLPLAGPEEFDLEEQEKLPPSLQFLPRSKKREPDSALRLIHIETLLLLCTTRWGRDFLRENGTYEIIRAMHETEQVDKISEHIERLVNLLKRDEGAGGDESEDDRIEEV